jgi:outer membrane protein
MKNLSLTLNIVLLAAVAFLYYLHFSAHSEIAPIVPLAPLRNANIVFVNSDSLIEQYTYFKNKKSEFEEKQAKVKAELKAESSRLQNEIQEYQQKAGTMTDQQRGQLEEQLSMKQQQFIQKKDEMLAKLDEEQSKGNEELYMKLNSFMKEFNRNKNYNFILGYQKGGGILYANDSLNITGEVLSGLNKAYDKELKGK